MYTLPVHQHQRPPVPIFDVQPITSTKIPVHQSHDLSDRGCVARINIYILNIFKTVKIQRKFNNQAYPSCQKFLPVVQHQQPHLLVATEARKPVILLDTDTLSLVFQTCELI